jgi:hypothetical protein
MINSPNDIAKDGAISDPKASKSSNHFELEDSGVQKLQPDNR